MTETDTLPEIQHARDLGHQAADRTLPARSRWRRPSTWVAMVCALIVAVAVVVLGVQAHQTQTTVTRLGNNVSDLQGALGEANRRIIAKGGVPVATPSGVPGPQGATGPAGPAPSDAQVQAAVTAYCAIRSDCTGTPSAVQVAAAVRAYCAAGACRGTTGQTGPTGATGPAGATGPTGAPGASPSTADVQNAVAAYCQANGGCTGPAGPKGDTGAAGQAGAAGRGIASVDCTGLGIDSLRITYDDGTTQDVPCTPTTPTGAPSS